MEKSLSEIKNLLQAEVVNENGQGGKNFCGVASLEDAGAEDIAVYYNKEKNRQAFLETKAGACVVDVAFYQNNPTTRPDLCLLLVKDPNLAFAKLMNLFYGEKAVPSGISSQAFVASSAKVGSNCSIMFGSYIGENVKIGNNVIIYPQVFIGDNVIIEDNCIIHHSASLMNATVGHGTIIHGGARIGKDGFRYAQDEAGNHIKISHRGGVRIGNNVEIGANSTIDRGVLDDTIIGDMCKLDNLVQVGHNVILGKGCILVSQVGIAGSSKLGKYVMLGGQVGVADHITIGDGTKVAAQSGIMQHLAPGSVVMGTPAQPIKEFFRQVATLKKLVKKKENV